MKEGRGLNVRGLGVGLVGVVFANRGNLGTMDVLTIGPFFV